MSARTRLARLLLRAAVVATAVPALLPAQRAAAVPAPDRVPVHAGRDGRLWTAGADWKAALDAGGMAFYPRLGASAPRNLPLVWRTRSVAFDQGPTLLADGAPARAVRADAFGVDLEHEGLTERYLVRAEGLEQQFLVAARPGPADAVPGDLVVRGLIEGPLVAAARAPRHGAVAFGEPGRPGAVVEYGAAVAFDADGLRCEVTTAVDGREVELRVPAAFVRAARFPLLIDPLTRRASAVAGTSPAAAPSIARDDAQNRILVSAARASAAGDWDLFVHVLDDDFGTPRLIYSDLTTDSTRISSAAWAPTQHRWVVAMEVHDAASWQMRVLFHDTADTRFGTGRAVAVPRSPEGHLSQPALGTSATSNIAYLAAKLDVAPAGPADTLQSQVVGFAIDVHARTVGSLTTLGVVAGRALDMHHPQISASTNRFGYVVVWQEWDPALGGGWDVIGRRIAPTGVPTGPRAQLLGGDNHELTPVIAGGDHRWLLAAVRRPRGDGQKTASIVGDRLLTRRIAWPDSPAPPQLESVFQLDSSAPASAVRLGVGRRPIAYDEHTLSHWSIAWQRTDLDSLPIARVGYDGMLVERADLEPPAPLGIAFDAPSLCHDPDGDGVAAVYASSGLGLGEPIQGRRFTHDPGARATSYGTGCAGVASAANASVGARPWRGSELFRVSLDGAAPSAPVWLLAAPLPGAVPLPAGAPRCLLLLDPATVLPVIGSGVTDGAGQFDVPLALPSWLTPMTIHWQFVQLDAGELRGSTGLRTDVR